MKGLTVAATFLLAGTALAAPGKPEPSAPRTITFTASGTPPLIRTVLLESTLIALPSEEKIATVFGGDTVDWVFDAGHVASRYLSIKPKKYNGITNVHIVSDHGNEYSLQLREVSDDTDPHFDANVFLTPGDEVAKDKMDAAPAFVPASETAELEKQLADAKAAQQTDRKAAQDAVEKTRTAYPGELHFDYAWDRGKATRLGVQQIRNGFSSQTSEEGEQILNHFLNRLPVITLKEGSRARVYIGKDILIPSYAEHRVDPTL